MKIKIFLDVIKDGFNGIRMSFFSTRRDHYGYIAQTSHVQNPAWGPRQNVFIYEHCGINAFSKFICSEGSFIVKDNCSICPGLTVITNNHLYDRVGMIPEGKNWGILVSNNIVVNEHVWIGANVTLCPGTIIGRGCIIAAGSVCIKTKEYPPYSIIGGNPAIFIKFRLSFEEQVKQEELFFLPEDRISSKELESNFKQFNNKIKI
jgi:acetyltransferase-like isoleucine patch superfamily enzyme